MPPTGLPAAKDVDRLLRELFFPVLVAQGFHRSRLVLRRVNEPVVHVVEVTHSVAGRRFYARLGVNLTFLPGVDGRPVPAEDTREPQCFRRGGLTTGFGVGDDWRYGNDVEQTREMVEFLVSEWPRQSRKFFGPLTTWPADFHAWVGGIDLGTTHPGHLLTAARVAVELGDRGRAAEIVDAALARVPVRATSLQEALIRVREQM